MFVSEQIEKNLRYVDSVFDRFDRVLDLYKHLIRTGNYIFHCIKGDYPQISNFLAHKVSTIRVVLVQLTYKFCVLFGFEILNTYSKNKYWCVCTFKILINVAHSSAYSMHFFKVGGGGRLAAF